MDAQKFFQRISLGAIALGIALFALRSFVTDHPSSPLPVNPAAHARDPIALIPTNLRKPLDDFSYMDAQGNSHHIKELWGEHPVLIHFWATWCGPCLPELPDLNTLAKRQSGHLRVMPFSLDRDAIATVTKFFELHHYDALAIIAPGAETPTPEALPTSILVDRSGKIAWTTAGSHPWEGSDIDQAVNELER